MGPLFHFIYLSWESDGASLLSGPGKTPAGLYGVTTPAVVLTCASSVYGWCSTPRGQLDVALNPLAP
jgi:hypothetical protein